jgi:hypothetical protein
VSVRGDLLHALAAYRRALTGRPGENGLAERLLEVEQDVKDKPDPEPSDSPPPVHGQTAPDDDNQQPAIHVHFGGWPSKAGRCRAHEGRSMSAFPLTAPGAIQIDAAAAIAQTYNGFGKTAGGKIATSGAAHSYWHNGFSFDSANKLRTVAEGTVAHVHNGFGFDSTDRLVTTATLPTTPPHSGLLFDLTRRVHAV